MQVNFFIESRPLLSPFRIARGSKSTAELLVVELESGKYRGRGEAVPYARYGENSENIMESLQSLGEVPDRDALQEALPAGAARAALDAAFWELECQQEGVSVWRKAGLVRPVMMETAFTLSLASPQEMEAAASAVKSRALLKIKLGTPEDLPRLEAVRRGAPDTKLMIDANEGWQERDYLGLLPHLEKLGVIAIEQPFPAGEDGCLRNLPRPIPVIADESCHTRADIPGLVGAYDMINIKLDKAGGLTEALALAKEARMAGLTLMTGCMVASSLAMTPALLPASLSSIVDLDGPLLLAKDREPGLLYDGSNIDVISADRVWGAPSPAF